jgi:hypothetical protein
MADSLNSANPIAAAGGFAGRAAGQQGSQAKAHSPRAELATAGGDAVELSAAPVRQLLRERILARTRVELGLAATATGGPEFAEAIDSESVAAFVAGQWQGTLGCSPPDERAALRSDARGQLRGRTWSCGKASPIWRGIRAGPSLRWCCSTRARGERRPLTRRMSRS